MFKHTIALGVAVALALVSYRAYAVEQVTAAKAKANNAYRLTSARACRARCAELSGESPSSANCTNNCKPGCYYNSGTGNYYCVP